MSFNDLENAKEKDLAGDFKKLYILGEKVGGGGNSIVRKATEITTGDTFAVKILKKRKRGAIDRFKNEIDSLYRLKKENLDTVISILNHCNKGSKHYWYVMPLGATITRYFSEQNFTAYQKMEVFLEIARALESIHGLGYSHRDIKPGNILVLNGEIVLADFGLVWHPEQLSITRVNERVGPFYTMAPEMARPDLERKHDMKADVYSFAKTFWMLLTNKEYSFYGQYSYQSKDFLDYNMYKNEGIRTLATVNELLYEATYEDLYKRPTMKDVIDRLEKWITENLKPDISRNLNEMELAKKGVARIESNQESYTEFEKIRMMIDVLSNGKILSFNMVSQRSFNAHRVLNYGDGLLILFDDIQNSKYMLKPKELVIEKREWKITLGTETISMESIPDSELFVFTDVNELGFVESLFSEEDPSGKDDVLVISDASSLRINLFQ